MYKLSEGKDRTHPGAVREVPLRQTSVSLIMRNSIACSAYGDDRDSVPETSLRATVAGIPEARKPPFQDVLSRVKFCCVLRLQT